MLAPMRLPDPGPVLDKDLVPMGPEILSRPAAGVWRKASMAFPGSSSVLDKFQSAKDAASSATQGRKKYIPPPWKPAFYQGLRSRLSFPATGPPDPGRVSEGFEKGSLKGL